MRKILVSFLLLMGGTGWLLAETFSGNYGNYSWSLNTEDSTLVFDGSGPLADHLSDWYGGGYYFDIEPPVHWLDKREYIRNITFPDGITRIGKETFKDCYNLKRLILPDNVTEIGNSSFAGCRSLQYVQMSDSMKRIETDAFKGCNAIQTVCSGSMSGWLNITFDSPTSNPLYYAQEFIPSKENSVRFNSAVNITDDCPRIGQYAFCHFLGMKSLKLTADVDYIGKDAFEECDSLQELIMSDVVS